MLQGDSKTALEHFSKAQSIFERIHKWESNPDMSMSYERMAEALYARGD
jgi:hypothetical protein